MLQRQDYELKINCFTENKKCLNLVLTYNQYCKHEYNKVNNSFSSKY